MEIDAQLNAAQLSVKTEWCLTKCKHCRTNGCPHLGDCGRAVQAFRASKYLREFTRPVKFVQTNFCAIACN